MTWTGSAFRSRRVLHPPPPGDHLVWHSRCGKDDERCVVGSLVCLVDVGQQAKLHDPYPSTDDSPGRTMPCFRSARAPREQRVGDAAAGISMWVAAVQPARGLPQDDRSAGRWVQRLELLD